MTTSIKKPTLFSHEAIMAQAETHDLCYYFWSHEVSNPAKPVFDLPPYLGEDGETMIEQPTGPLLVDISSARAYKAVFDALYKDRNREKFKSLAEEHRGLFVGVIMDFCWKEVSFKGANW